MCNYTQREFSCNHVRWIVSRWCPLYARTQRRCPPHVTHCEYRGNEVCGECKPSAPIVWESMIRRNNAPVRL
ncbi:hypothetical protein CGRA01v4_13298 [Colletotrichum graminicola]|nr:hypothetical protein CGRA01v4_13298 [Colletotrichum graminicola]